MAKRPPSSGTSGRNSGGITGMTFSTIHSGLFLPPDARNAEKTVQKEPGKKPAPSKKPKPQQEVVVQIPLSELHPFPDHPFQVREDASMQETAESVKEYGVLVPALARPREDAPHGATRTSTPGPGARRSSRNSE